MAEAASSLNSIITILILAFIFFFMYTTILFICEIIRYKQLTRAKRLYIYQYKNRVSLNK